MDFEIKNLSKLLYGGEESIQLTENDDNKNSLQSANVEVYYPKMTRETLSIYEYVGVITKLAKYLNSLVSSNRFGFTIAFACGIFTGPK